MSSKGLRLVLKLYRNGACLGEINPNNLNHTFISEMFSASAEQAFMQIWAKSDEIFDELIQQLKPRGQHYRKYETDEYTHLGEAYEKAREKNYVTRSGRTVTMSLLDVKTLDQETPMGGVKSSGEGWWRIYEHGSPGARVGQSSTHGFLPSKDRNENYYPWVFDKEGSVDERMLGKHGEGIMIKLSSRLARNVGLEPHAGVKPFRIARGFQSSVRSFYYEYNMKERICGAIAKRIAR